MYTKGDDTRLIILIHFNKYSSVIPKFDIENPKRRSPLEHR
jgi:hypothetical protein